jgi:hypothetical protein
MYLDDYLLKLLLNKKVISALDIGDFSGTDNQIYTPVFTLDNGFSVGIEYKTILKCMDLYKDLIGLKLLNIEQKKTNLLNSFLKKINL